MATPRDATPGRTLEDWESWVDKAIRDAQQRGDFDNLPGKGRPVRVGRNPLAGDRELGFHVLKNADVLPPWMELARDAAEGMAALEAFLVDSRERLARLARRACARSEPQPGECGPVVLRWLRGGFPEWRTDSSAVSVGSVERERQVLRARYLERAVVVDGQIKDYNAALPDDLGWLERPRLLSKDAAARFDAACPPVTCSSSDDE